MTKKMPKADKAMLIAVVVIALFAVGTFYKNDFKIKPFAITSGNLDYIKGKCGNPFYNVYQCSSYYCIDSLSGRCVDVDVNCKNAPVVFNCLNLGGVITPQPITPVCEEQTFGESWCENGQPYKKLRLSNCQETKYQIDICTSTEKCENGNCVSNQPPPITPPPITPPPITPPPITPPPACPLYSPLQCGADEELVPSVDLAGCSTSKCVKIEGLPIWVYVVIIGAIILIGGGILYFNRTKKKGRKK